MKPPPVPSPAASGLALDPAVVGPIVAVVCVVGGIVFALVRGWLGRRARAQIPLWARGAYGLWTGGEDSGTWDKNRASQSLASWYGVNTSDQFRELIEGLRRGQTGSPAWDKVRALDLLRIGAAGGFLDEEACWEQTAAIGTELQALHHSWTELAQAFEAGMQAWQRGRGIDDPEQLGRVQRNLPVLQGQVWPQIPYDTRLPVDD